MVKTARTKHLSYWVLPVISGVIWIATLLGLLLYWIIDTNRKRYPSMTGNKGIAYISDIGAFTLKPLFIAGCSLTSITLDLSFLADRWLRHQGRLVPNSTLKEKILSWLTIVFAILGTAGLILLSVFDTNSYHRAHDGFLLLFMGGYILSAAFICWEYQLLGKHNRQHRVLRVSFWIKLTFVLVELVLCAVFVGTTFTEHYDVGAVFEWIIAFIFSLYVFSFVVDLYPAIYTKPGAQFPRGGLNGRTDEEARHVEEVLEHHRFTNTLDHHNRHPGDSARTLTEDDLAPGFAGVGRGMDERLRSSHGQRPVSKAGPVPNNF